MKSFLYTKTTGKRLPSGGCIMTFYVYRIKRNEPFYLGKKTANSGSYPGDRQSVYQFLMDNGHVPTAAGDTCYFLSAKFHLFNV